MTYIDAQLPRRISTGLKIGPEWRTRIKEMANGGEERNAQWLYPRWRAQGNMAAFVEADRAAFRGMFVAARGRWAAFRVFDPMDSTASGALLLPQIGTSNPVQLRKPYTFPGSVETVWVLIQAPQAGSVTVFKDGVPVAGTLDAGFGLFTPAAPWDAGVYTWTGRHDRWMRFDSDWGAFTANTQDIYETDIELVEVRRRVSA